MEDARALLNSLMGADRNAKAEQRKARSFKDDDICKDFLLGLCPHELFTSTKLDLGPCNKHHNEDFKEQFESAKDAAQYRRRWRRRLDSKLRGLLSDVDRRISINKQRMERDKEGGGFGASEEQTNQLSLLREEVSEKLKLAEQAADDGKFEESRKIMTDTEGTKRRIEDLENRSFEKYKKDHICHICGLIIDGEEAEAMKTGRGWHINGKQHLGYTAIRAKLQEFDEQEAEDRKEGVKSASPSPVKAPRPAEAAKKRDKSRSRSQKRPHKAEGRRRRSGSRSAGKAAAVAKEEKRRVNRSRSRAKAKASRSRSVPRKVEKKESKRRASPSPQRRSKSRRRAPSRKKKRSASRRRKRSRSGKKSPSRSRSASRKRDAKKAKKGRRKASSGSAGSSAPPPEEKEEKAAEAKPPPPPAEKAEAPATEPEQPAEEEEEEAEDEAASAKMKVPVRFFLGLQRRG